MTLQVEVKNNVIVFIDGSRKFITQETYDRIMKISTTPSVNIENVDIDGSFYKLKSIAKLLTAGAFYEQYPKERPSERRTFQVYGEEYVSIDKQIMRRKRRIKSVITGIQEYINGPNCQRIDVSKELLKRWEARLATLETN